MTPRVQVCSVAELTDAEKLVEIQRRCQVRIEMVAVQNENQYNRNTRPAWILVEDVLNIITPDKKYSTRKEEE